MYQTILAELRDIMQSGTKVQVKLRPEPENVHDQNAISFQCFHQNEWKTIGYVVAEICDDVLTA